MSNGRIFVTGANGFIGSALVESLRHDGFDVCGMLGRSSQGGGRFSDAELFQGDICDSDSYRHYLKGAEVVIHLAGLAHMPRRGSAFQNSLYQRVNVEATEKLAKEGVANGVRRFIFISSISVYEAAFSSGECVTEETEAVPLTIYGKTKLEAERRLEAIAKNSHMEFVILQPALVVGSEAPGNLSKLKKLVLSGIPFPVPMTDNRRCYVSRETLIDILKSCITSRTVANDRFIITEGPHFSTQEIVKCLAEGSERKALFPRVPDALLGGFFWLVGQYNTYKKLYGNLPVSGKKAESIFGPFPAGRLRAAFLAVGASH